MCGTANIMKTAKAILVLIFCTATVNAVAQDVTLRAQLFSQADEANSAAIEAKADVLAPASYAEASSLYRRADQNLTRGRSIQDIREDLAEATRLFLQARERAGVARVTLTPAIEARDDALGAEAPGFSAELWSEAEETFRDAATRLENGNLNRARNTAAEAEQEFRAAELDAIEVNYFAATRDLIAQANRLRVDRAAPKTLARAESLLDQAEAALRQNRYDTDLPRSLAREARYEASHSIYLAGRVNAVDDRDFTIEDVLLQSEEPLVRLGGQLDLVVEFDEGFGPPTSAMAEAIQELQSRSQTLVEREEQLAFLEGEISLLEARLGEESESRRLQEQIQQRFEQLAAVFSRDEATVLRSGDEVIVRLGLNFDSGSDVIRPNYYPLLRKIQTAIDLFPDSRVEVQGHTDSFGDDASNQALSRSRANSVLQYLSANMALGATTLDAVGYGETVPLANNETPEGRTRNRRIDLLIQPNMERLRSALASR
jgi:outer membrane protein OmpA-like peptidoglycan-associated protein